MIYLERKICPVCPEKVKCGTLLHPPNLSMHNLKYSTNVVFKKKYFSKFITGYVQILKGKNKQIKTGNDAGKIKNRRNKKSSIENYLIVS